MFTYEQRRDSVILEVFERWTNNGQGMDFDEKEKAVKAVNDAVTNAYFDNADTDTGRDDWVNAALERLRGKGMTQEQFIESLTADFARYGFIDSPLTVEEMKECHCRGFTVAESYDIGCDVSAGFDFKGFIGGYDAE